jgi:hypothetical protein
VIFDTVDPGGSSSASSEAPAFTAHGAQTLPEEQAAVNDLLKSIREGGAGLVCDKKPSDVIRLYGENVDSLSLYDESRKWKTNRLHQHMQRYQCDGGLLIETGVDFRKLPEEKGLDVLLGDMDCRVTTANNVTEPSGRSQHGGVASILFPRLAGFCLDSGKDPTGLGRYMWTTVGTADRRTCIVTAYRPVKPSRKKRTGQRGWYTVWSQHRRYFHCRGISGSPRQRFASDLVSQLLAWKNSGYEIILFIDLNEHACKGR